jgi:hypothetical protein
MRLRREDGEIIPETDDADFEPSSDEECEGGGRDDEAINDDDVPEDFDNEDEGVVGAEEQVEVKKEAVAGCVPKTWKRTAGKPDPGARKRPPPVKYFQKALTNVYAALPSIIRKTYEKTAVEWRMNGPDEDVKQR